MKIGSFDFSAGKTFIIAELSANHNQSLDLALKSIRAVKETGADAIKIQTFTPDTITMNVKNKYFQASDLWEGEYLYDLYAKAYTPWEWHEELFSYARSLGLEVFSTPFDLSAVDFLEKLAPVAYKIASFEITDYQLIEYTASKGKPIIISTGIAKIEEIQDAVNICKRVGNDQIILLKCTSSYPAPLHEANLAMISSLRDTFGVVSGFSDHTMGIVAPVVAVSLGARVIEKHFILDKSLGGVDSGFSLDADEFKQMVDAIRDTETLLGTVDYNLSAKILKSREYGRSLFVAQDIKKGEVLTNNNVRSIRPGIGLHPKYLKSILGKRITKELHYGTPLSVNDIEGFEI